jgi:hypothetical protein
MAWSWKLGGCLCILGFVLFVVHAKLLPNSGFASAGISFLLLGLIVASPFLIVEIKNLLDNR